MFAEPPNSTYCLRSFLFISCTNHWHAFSAEVNRKEQIAYPGV